VGVLEVGDRLPNARRVAASVGLHIAETTLRTLKKAAKKAAVWSPLTTPMSPPKVKRANSTGMRKQKL
jgi:hypothetical protein